MAKYRSFSHPLCKIVVKVLGHFFVRSLAYLLRLLRKCVVNEEVGIVGKLFSILSAPFDLEFAYSEANMFALFAKFFGKLRSFDVSSFYHNGKLVDIG
jgi:hypothetical protein